MFWTMRKPRPGTGRGRGACGALLAVLSRPRPEQREAFTALIVEQVRVDWCIEGGVVELEREVVAAFLGALRPGGADLRSAHEDAVARSLIVGGIGFGDDADAFGLQAEGDDLALEIVSDLLERTDGSHVTSPVVFRARDHRGLDGDLQGRGRSATHPKGPERSGGRCRSDFLASRGMGLTGVPAGLAPWGEKPRGRKLQGTALRIRRARRSRSSARSSHHKGPVRRVPKRNRGRKVANLGYAVQEVRTVRR